MRRTPFQPRRVARPTAFRRLFLEPLEERRLLAGIQAYWTDTFTGVDNIQRAQLGGSGPQVVVDGLGNPQDVALDLHNNKVYWTDDL